MFCLDVFVKLNEVTELTVDRKYIQLFPVA